MPESKWSHPTLDGFYGRLDAVSADIKSLEAYLAKSGVRLPARVEVPGGGEVSWELGEPDRWRIIYSHDNERLPLIETKAEIRVRAGAERVLLNLRDAVANAVVDAAEGLVADA